MELVHWMTDRCKVRISFNHQKLAGRPKCRHQRLRYTGAKLTMESTYTCLDSSRTCHPHREVNKTTWMETIFPWRNTKATKRMPKTLLEGWVLSCPKRFRKLKLKPIWSLLSRIRRRPIVTNRVLQHGSNNKCLPRKTGTTCSKQLGRERTAMEELCHLVVNSNCFRWYTGSSIIKGIHSFICHVFPASMHS